MYTESELMAVEGSRYLRDHEIVFVGTGLPIVATFLAKYTHAPNLKMVVETGPFDPEPAHTPLSVSDGRLMYRAVKFGGNLDVLGALLQRGMIDTGFLGGAQIDMYGNINSTVIGDYRKPKIRLPGSGGACDISILSKRVLIITRHEKRRFPEKCDYITSPGYLEGYDSREKAGIKYGGPEVIVTDLCVMGFDEKTRKMKLLKLHPGVTVDDVLDNMGFEPIIPDDIKITEEPDEKQLRLLREQIDPEKIYIK